MTDQSTARLYRHAATLLDHAAMLERDPARAQAAREMAELLVQVAHEAETATTAEIITPPPGTFPAGN